MDVHEYNRRAWNREVAQGNPWTIPVTPEEVARARVGEVSLLLTPSKPVPADWWLPLPGCRVLCLASGGGQQGPILAAAGAHVTVFDASDAQLARDREVAEREGLTLRLEQGDMADLGRFDDGSYDLIFHPVSNCFAPQVRPVWREAFRVLRPGGVLLAGFINPVRYIFDLNMADEGWMVVRYALPYSDLTSPSSEEREKYIQNGEPLEFSHTLDEQIGGQLEAGFLLSGFFEDVDPDFVVGKHFPDFIATRAIKPA
ncbi:MAG: class I SAM-dependent methyltransferase [Anaerolineae bacterium]|nr:class I SAM-dependent methyltransferase [Anaerolineae bacterium]